MTMTRKDAIKTLRELWRETNNPWYEEVYNMAIEALQAKTDGDLISRADAIKAVWNAYADAINFGDSGEEIASDIDIILSALPSSEAVSREEVTAIKNNYINEISELLNKIDALSADTEWIPCSESQPAEADRPTGEWKGYNADNPDNPDWLRKESNKS